MDLTKATNIIEFEFNKIAEDLSRREVKDTIKKNRSEYRDFLRGAKLTPGTRFNRLFTKQGIKDGLVDGGLGIAAGTGFNMLSGNQYRNVGEGVALIPHVVRSKKRQMNRANTELENRYGKHSDSVRHYGDVKRAFAQSLRNKQNQ